MQPPHSVSLDGCNLILKRPQALQIWKQSSHGSRKPRIHKWLIKYNITSNAQHSLFFSPLSHAMPASLTWAVMPSIMETVSRSVTWMTKRSCGRGQTGQSGVNTLRLKRKWLERFFFFSSLWTPCQHSWSPFSPALTQSRRTGSWSHAWSVWWFLSAKLGRLGGNRPYWSAGPGTPSPRTADTKEDREDVVFGKIIKI